MFRVRNQRARSTRGVVCAAVLVHASLLLSPLASAEPGMIELKATAEKEIRSVDAEGNETVERVAADVVTPGERVVYTIRAANVGSEPTADVVITDPIPENMTYLAGTASGEASTIRFSVDAGKSYDAPENLIVLGDDGTPRPAEAADYTHIRWDLGQALAPGESRSVEFSARLD